MEAGLGNLTRMAPKSLDQVLLVANPTVKSLEVARRAYEMIAERSVTDNVVVVVNRLRDGEDLEEIRSAYQDLVIVPVPEDFEVRRADSQALCPLDVAPDSPAVQALTALAKMWPLPAQPASDA